MGVYLPLGINKVIHLSKGELALYIIVNGRFCGTSAQMPHGSRKHDSAATIAHVFFMKMI